MAPLNPLSVKIDDDLQAALLTIATHRQEQTGERTTISDVIRDLLQQGASKELQDHPSSIDVVEPCEEYHPIGRSLMKTVTGDEIKENPVKRNRMAITRAFAVAKRGCVPSQVFLDDEDFEIPPFEIACHPEWHMRLGDRPEEDLIRSAKSTIARLEDDEVLHCISASIPTANTILHSAQATGTIRQNVTTAASKLWSSDVTVHGIVYNPIHTDEMGAWVKEQRGLQWPRGDVDHVSHHPSTVCEEDTIILVGPPDILGRIVTYVDLTVTRADDPTRLRYGRVVWESIGIATLNGCAASKVCIV